FTWGSLMSAATTWSTPKRARRPSTSSVPIWPLAPITRILFVMLLITGAMTGKAMRPAHPPASPARRTFATMDMHRLRNLKSPEQLRAELEREGTPRTTLSFYRYVRLQDVETLRHT